MYRNLKTQLTYRIGLCAALFAGMSLSYVLWLPARAFPLAPLIALSSGVQWAALGLFCASMLFFTATGEKLSGWTAVAASALLLVSDMSRAQPWFLMYLACVVGILFGSELLFAALWMSGTYFWSGIHKANFDFVSRVIPTMTGIDFGSWPLACAIVAGVVVAGEIFIAFGVWSDRTRRPAVVLAICLHAFLLVRLSPFRTTHNIVIFPWNLFLLCSMPFVFLHVRPKFDIRSRLVVALALVSTTLTSIFSSLYTGREARVYAYLNSDEVGSVRSIANDHMGQRGQKTHLYLNGWSESLLKVPIPPFEVVYRRLARELCATASADSEVFLEVIRSKTLISSERVSSRYERREVCNL